MSDHQETVESRRQELEDTREYRTIVNSTNERHRHEIAEDIHSRARASKQESASSLNRDVDACRSRRDLYDALDDSERRERQHELKLKEELVAANRADRLNAVKERQADLQ